MNKPYFFEKLVYYNIDKCKISKYEKYRVVYNSNGILLYDYYIFLSYVELEFNNGL